MVLSESVTGIGARLGQKAGREAFENLQYDPQVKVVFLDRRLAERSLQVYMKYGPKLSFADAVSVRIMRDLKIERIASFDSDFDHVDGLERIH